MEVESNSLPLKSGFTLVELLVVVAIISILVAIALPNFLEAQVRAKASKAKSELRTIATALEFYRVEHDNYPTENYPSPLLVPCWGDSGELVIPNAVKLKVLTTPVAYLTNLPTDPFDPGDAPVNQARPPTYHYASRNDVLYPANPFFNGKGNNQDGRYCEWVMQSYGPDRGIDMKLPTHWQFPRYDPTNGTVSIGNILRLGP